VIGFLSGVVDFCRRHAWAVLALAVILAAASAAYVVLLPLGVNTDTSQLFSPDLPWRKQSAAYDRAFPNGVSQTIIVIDGESADAVEDGTAALTAALKQRPDLFLSVYRPDGGAFFDRYGLMFLPPEALGQLSDRVAAAEPLLGPLASDPSLRGLFGVLDQALTGMEQGEAAGAEQLAGPMAGFAAATRSVVEGQPHPVDWGRLMTGEQPRPEALRHFIEVQPRLDYAALEPGGAADRTIMDLARSLHLAERGVRVRLTGDVPLNDTQFASVTQGAGVTGAASMVLVVLIMLIGLRAPRAIVAIMLTLIFGLILTAAFAAAAVGTLNMVSVPFAVLFIGLGVDFGIQFTMRWRAELFDLAGEGGRADPGTALARTARSISAPLGLAAAAVAVGFYSFVPTDYRGVSELGLIAGTSMIIALFANLTVLPALLAVLPTRGRPEAAGFAWAAPGDLWLQRHPRLVLAVASLVGVAALASVPALRFDADPLDLQNPGLPPVATALELTRNPQTAPAIELLAPNLAAAEDLAGRLQQLPQVEMALSLASFVPADQPAKLDILGQMQLFLGPILDTGNQVPPPDAARERAASEQFLTHLTKFLASPAAAPIAAAGQDLAKALTRFLAMPGGGDTTLLRQTLLGGIEGRIEALRAAMAAGPVTAQTMPEEFKSHWIAADGRARLEVFAKGNIRNSAVLADFVGAVRSLAPDATGGLVLILETGRTVSHAFLIASIYALIGITIVLAVMLRRLRDVVLVIVPLVLAGLYTLGATVLLGLPFNYANIITVPLLMGIGVAFDIYFVMLWRAGSGPVALLQTPTARAVVFSACTTATAFGSLALSYHAGTASMGVLLIIALFFVLVSTLLVQPALMTLVGRGRR
jgi:hopanoid biosynthesis associated RND transporter like protein HpnN